MEFQPQYSYISCGNGCNAHFQCVADEARLREICHEHDLICTKEYPYKNDPNAFYFAEDIAIVALSVPDYSNFSLRFMSNRAYDTVVQKTANQRSVTRMEALAIARSENFPLVKFFWDEIVAGLTIPPSSLAIDGWNAIASECFMPFEFDKSARMVLL